MATGWTFEQIGDLTPVQVRVVYTGIKRNMGRWVEFAGCLFGGKRGKPNAADATASFEARLAAAKANTGRDKFGILELI